MSARTLLSYLAGHRPYALHRWLRGDQVEPRVAWYPSAGIDLHDLIYLSAEYRHYRPGVRGIEDPPEPTLFLHTEFSRDHFQFFAERDVLLHDEGLRRRVRLCGLSANSSEHEPSRARWPATATTNDKA